MSGPSRFGLPNYVNGGGAGIIQGYAGLNHFPVYESASAPQSNLLYGDRLVLFSTGAQAWPIATFVVDIGLDATRTLSAVGIHGLRLGRSTAFDDIKIAMQTGAYDGTGTWDYLTAGTIPQYESGILGGPMFSRDTGKVFAPKASVQTVRLLFENVTGPFSLGKVYAGVPFDVGSIVSAPNMEMSPQINAVNYTLPSGTTFQFRLGDNSRTIAIVMTQVTAAQVLLLEALAIAGSPFTFIDNLDHFHDCVFSDKQLGVKQTSPTLYTVSLNLVALP